MLDRVSVSVALATIFAVLGKLALLYRAANESWFRNRVDQEIFYIALISVFLIFFRGKMMHDDSAFFKELANGKKFKNDKNAKVRIKSGLMAGYLSWLCWAPAIYFLERPKTLGWWLVASIGISTIWLFTDIKTRELPDSDPEAKKRRWFLYVNIIYAVPLIFMATQLVLAACAAGLLVLILVLDWLVSDTFGPFASSSGA